VPEQDPLIETPSEKLLPIARGLLGIIPVAGGLLGEIITQIIPNQRADRLVHFVRLLEAKFQGLESEVRELIAQDSERIALVEDGAYQAARAIDPERIKMIANCVVSGVAPSEKNLDYRRKLLDALGQLSDFDFVVVKAHITRGGLDAISPPGPYVGERREEDVRADAHWNATLVKLIRMDLLRVIHVDLNDTVPSSNKRRITLFGLDLLRSAGVDVSIPTGLLHGLS
jgi:hypothetical protein